MKSYITNFKSIIIKFAYKQFQMSTLEDVKKCIKESGDAKEAVELNLSEIKIGKLTPQIKKAIEACKNLQILIMTDCELTSLDNLPELDLTAIDLTANKLGDSQLAKLANYKNLGQLIFNQNEVSKLQSLKVLSKLEHLQEIDFTDNPVSKLDNYRTWVFDNLPKLEVLDRFDRDGNEQLEEDEFVDDEDDEEDFDDDEDGDDDDDDEEFDEDDEEESPPPKKKK